MWEEPSCWVGRGRAHAYVRFTMLQRWEEASKDVINSIPRSIDVHVSGCMQTFGMHCRARSQQLGSPNERGDRWRQVHALRCTSEEHNEDGGASRSQILGTRSPYFSTKDVG